MQEPISAHRYIRYVWQRRRWIALSGAVAAALAAVVSLLITAQYTARVRLVIEPPAGTDLRAAMAVSPIYLESLRTYEQFAASDTLFVNALERFRLRSFYPALPLESIKKRTLRVEILRNTRILVIEATLPDPAKAKALARFLAESAVALNRSLVSEGDRDLVAGFESQQKELRAKLDRLDAESARLAAEEPVYNLRPELEKDQSLRLDLEQQRAAAERDAAEDAARARSASASIRSAAAARLQEIRRQLAELDRHSAERERLLSSRQARRDQLDSERRALQPAVAAIETRLREARGDAGYRGERLKVIDPGIVPEKPSSPNLPLNVVAALLLGLLLPAGYFVVELQFRQQGAASRPALRKLARAVDE